MSGNKWWSANVGARFLSELVTFLILFCEIPLDFHSSTWVLPLKY